MSQQIKLFYMFLCLLEDCGPLGSIIRFFCQCGPGPPRIPCIPPFSYCFPCLCCCYCGEPRCPHCRSANVGFIWWGTQEDAQLDPITNEMIANGEIILGGSPREHATHQCNKCGERFNNFPLWMQCCWRGTCPLI